MWSAGQGLIIFALEKKKDMWDIQNPKTCYVLDLMAPQLEYEFSE